jgi:hypothetical protein
MEANVGIQEIIVAAVFVVAVLYLLKRFVIRGNKNKCSDCALNSPTEKK